MFGLEIHPILTTPQLLELYQIGMYLLDLIECVKYALNILIESDGPWGGPHFANISLG